MRHKKLKYDELEEIEEEAIKEELDAISDRSVVDEDDPGLIFEENMKNGLCRIEDDDCEACQ